MFDTVDGWRLGLACILGAWAFGCAGRVGTQPHDASAAHHAAAAEQAEGQVRLSRVNAASRTGCTGICWTEAIDARRDRKRYRKLAALHREAHDTLVGAEAKACKGLPPADRDISPFFHRLDVISVQPVREKSERPSAAGGSARTLGALVVFRPVPGLTLERLQGLVDCHIARAAVIGHRAPELGFCPLAPKGVRAQTYATGGGLAVAITADEQDSAAEVWRRAAALMERSANEDRREGTGACSGTAPCRAHGMTRDWRSSHAENTSPRP